MKNITLILTEQEVQLLLNVLQKSDPFGVYIVPIANKIAEQANPQLNPPTPEVKEEVKK